ncbi:MAG: hypothetical protein FD143_2356 [Ignavibacteria bacterium]|nr:MAG: hypothetical protein FD143_2356 [Ignavibacteria bacterium]KAF0159696.1 MAG: hypothetical protein FD188_2125 [Ignavibacteria bacterium]
MIGLSALGLAISSRWSSKTVKNISHLFNKKVEIKIHPEAVKRSSKA